jgi:hypothetical protein
MFTRQLTIPTGDECLLDDVSHNFEAADPPEEGEDTGDNNWAEEGSQEVSPEVFFGRLEETSGDPVLIIGNDAYPGVSSGKGAWTFSWEGSSASQGETTHASGYLYRTETTVTSTVRISGTFAKGSFTGTHESDDITASKWTEADTWSDEVAAVISTTGQIPASSYLVRDDGAGNLVPAYNDYASFDCVDSDCTLSVRTTCAYYYELTGIFTEFTPDDNRWVEDAGQAAGVN